MWCAFRLVYGAHSINERRQVWGELKEAKERFGVLLLLMGDFNETLNLGERNGTDTITRNMREFGESAYDLNLMDLPIIGQNFT